MKYLNGMFVKVKALLKQLTPIENGWNQYNQSKKPTNKIIRWETRLKALDNEMSTLNTHRSILEKAKLWNQVQGTPSFMWNMSIWQATSFIDLSSRGITEQFEKEMTTPYKQMIQNEVHVNAQSDQSAQEMP